MIVYRDIFISNGEMMVKYRIYQCSCCKEEVEEAFPYYIDDKNIYCMDCAFKNKKVSEKKYLENSGVLLDKARVLISPDNEVIVCIGIAPWEIKSQDYRNTQEYKELHKRGKNE